MSRLVYFKYTRFCIRSVRKFQLQLGVITSILTLSQAFDNHVYFNKRYSSKSLKDTENYNKMASFIMQLTFHKVKNKLNKILALFINGYSVYRVPQCCITSRSRWPQFHYENGNQLSPFLPQKKIILCY